MGQIENNKILDLSPVISLITLNVKGLNTSIKCMHLMRKCIVNCTSVRFC